MMEKNAKIYVAGHRGMVGSAIVRELERLSLIHIYAGKKRFVLPQGFQNLQKALLPGIIGFLPGQRAGSVLLAAPFHKVVNILKVVIKGHAVDPAVVGQVADRDFVQRFVAQQFLERSFQCALCHLRHG